MAAHWNIQINIQRVSEIPPPAPTYRGITGQKPEKAERVITNVLELKVTADSEPEAYAKAHRMLRANQPELLTAAQEYSTDQGRGRAVRDAPQA